jgi:hypothetical protein
MLGLHLVALPIFGVSLGLLFRRRLVGILGGVGVGGSLGCGGLRWVGRVPGWLGGLLCG